MRDNDLKCLEEAYGLVQEKGFKSMAAAAAMGLSGLAHAQQISPDDYADRANPHNTTTDSVVSHARIPQEGGGDTAWHKAQMAYAKAVAKKGLNVDIETLKNIAGDKETAEKYGLYLLQFGHKIPDIIKDASKKKIEQTERDFASEIKN